MSDIAADAILGFQDLLARVPDLVQPLVVAAAGAVPFIEGEGAATIGIIGGINPVIAAISGAVGNFVCVALLVLLGAGVRSAVTKGRTRKSSARREKFQRAFTRYGVPGVSLLGPLLLPTHFTAVMLAGAGVAKGRVLLWQGVAIVLWTTALTVVVSLAVGGAGLA
ncbi:small multidrug efflux protein [Rathayibacter caricis DSM 15933]|uniref:Small multidrug efflux protein n=1 Tax=Rathayibacter caricis DSM 15933 TaxID=1328867 RepID=A0A2T4URX9_9MICO|nr:small multidrug efflux protein [Rathayibacter caricis]PTL72276.1 small multidrug efflux protein [Rathayibacter caricis DSM 15933]